MSGPVLSDVEQDRSAIQGEHAEVAAEFGAHGVDIRAAKPTEVGIGMDRRLAERYSDSAAEYARCWSPVILPMGKRLVRSLPIAEAARVLDVGTGTGALVEEIRSAAPRALVVGVDGAIGMLRVARARTAGPLPLAAMDARRLGFPAESFDAAVLAFMLFHLSDPVAGLVEVRRVLREGGVVGVTTWGTRPPFAASDVWDEELSACGAGPDPYDAPDRDDLMDTPEKLASLLTSAGFGGVASWSERFVHRWDTDSLVAQRVAWGSYRRRLETLEAPARADCLARVQDRLRTLAPADFAYCPMINFATATKGIPS